MSARYLRGTNLQPSVCGFRAGKHLFFFFSFRNLFWSQTFESSTRVQDGAIYSYTYTRIRVQGGAIRATRRVYAFRVARSQNRPYLAGQFPEMSPTNGLI